MLRNYLKILQVVDTTPWALMQVRTNYGGNKKHNGNIMKHKNKT